MKIPPIDWEDLVALGMDPAAMVLNTNNIVIIPRPSPLISRLISLTAVTPPPDSQEDRFGYLRAIRDGLMLCTDWTQLPDTSLTPEQRALWVEYRQALRDLPSVYSGTGPIPWPQEPN